MIESAKLATSIDGVWLQPLAIIPTPDGPVLHMLREGYALMPASKFGELYFSEVWPGHVKAWKRHNLQNQLFAVPMGQIEIALYDARRDSPTLGVTASLILGRPDHYCLLSIPHGIWYGFRALGANPALVCNCADRGHDPAEVDKLPFDSDLIPFHWSS